MFSINFDTVFIHRILDKAKKRVLSMNLIDSSVFKGLSQFIDGNYYMQQGNCTSVISPRYNLNISKTDENHMAVQYTAVFQGRIEQIIDLEEAKVGFVKFSDGGGLTFQIKDGLEVKEGNYVIVTRKVIQNLPLITKDEISKVLTDGKLVEFLKSSFEAQNKKVTTKTDLNYVG